MIHEAVPKLHRCCKQPPEPHKQQHTITNHTITIYSITITIHTTTITTDQNHYEWWNDPLARLCLSCTGVAISLPSLANNKQHKADRHRLTIEIKEKLSWLLKHMLNVCYFLLNMHIFALQCWLLRAMSGKGWNGTVDSVTYTGVSLPSCFRHGFLASFWVPSSVTPWVSERHFGGQHACPSPPSPAYAGHGRVCKGGGPKDCPRAGSSFTKILLQCIRA